MPTTSQCFVFGGKMTRTIRALFWRLVQVGSSYVVHTTNDQNRHFIKKLACLKWMNEWMVIDYYIIALGVLFGFHVVSCSDTRFYPGTKKVRQRGPSANSFQILTLSHQGERRRHDHLNITCFDWIYHHPQWENCISEDKWMRTSRKPYPNFESTTNSRWKYRGWALIAPVWKELYQPFRMDRSANRWLSFPAAAHTSYSTCWEIYLLWQSRISHWSILGERELNHSEAT